ncbi:PQQ-binding-like beta-propeller repeat protein [Dactylosporangium sp. CA-139114]|uniref:outer membrane protein assembly factor BamB family protein n=1 Tax=Dactylosporangium sp. CA-139114 TaxID=3239931 RepID=UPI003D9833D3
MIDLDAEPRGATRRSRRPWRGFSLLLVGVLGLAGGARPGTSLDPAVVLRGDGVSAVDSDGSAMYVLSRASVAAYRMPDGARRWAVPVAAGTQLLAVDDARVVVGVQNGTRLAAAALVGLDSATGAQVWRRIGYVPVGRGCACGVVVAEMYPPGSDPEQEGQQSTPYLAGIDVHTGAVRWSLVTPPGGRRRVVFGPGERVRVAVFDTGGTLRLYSAETAEVVRTVGLEDHGQVDELTISGDRLLVYRSGLGTILGTTAFDLATGRRLWQRTAEPDGENLWWCGRAICARATDGANDGPTVVLDPDTGRERWRVGERTELGGLTDRYMLATPSPPDGHHLVLDAATGRVVRRIDGWEPVGDLAGTRLLVAGRSAAGGSLIARLDIETGAVTVLARAPGWSAPPECFTMEALLACKLDQDRIPVWRWAAAPAGWGKS